MFYKLVSPMMTSIHGVSEFLVDYKVGQWATPPIEGSKLFVFGNYDDAMFFMGQQKSILFQCEVVNPTPITKATYPVWMFEFWRGETVKELYLPQGTFGCDSVKVTEAIASSLPRQLL